MIRFIYELIKYIYIYCYSYYIYSCIYYLSTNDNNYKIQWTITFSKKSKNKYFETFIYYL